MNERHKNQQNPFAVESPEVGCSGRVLKRRSSFTKTHWSIVVGLWFVWSIIYVCGVASLQRSDPDRVKDIMLTPLVTVVAPMLGAMLRDFQSCCLQVSLEVLLWVLPIPPAAALLQWLWNPDAWILRAFRMLVWILAWLLWFSSGILPLGHALS